MNAGENKINTEQNFSYDMVDVEKAWCPGCGNYAMHRNITAALSELNIDPTKLVFCSGIGQAAKFPQYTRSNMFNGLHGRALPAAMAIKAANPGLTVISYSGDGCSYGEGQAHFIHQILRNPDFTMIVSDNQIYGLTKGQASPTSLQGMKTPVQVTGVTNEPYNPIAVAVSLGASFVARVFVGDKEQTKEIVKKAILHKGFALMDCFSPCVSFNKLNDYKWYKEHTYYLEDSYDPTDQKEAFAKALETEKYPLGIIYTNKSKPVFWETTAAYKNTRTPLYSRELNIEKLKKLIESTRS
jgi:2-oxoglutarate/2-oxoacid ferredoxin oxidoreductase subunit beta